MPIVIGILLYLAGVFSGLFISSACYASRMADDQSERMFMEWYNRKTKK